MLFTKFYAYEFLKINPALKKACSFPVLFQLLLEYPKFFKSWRAKSMNN